jgi:rhodanese-related sulfurtransferase
VARQLRQLGFDADALQGGYEAWRAKYPVAPKPAGTTHTG